jgi:hypothetical protein
MGKIVSYYFLCALGLIDEYKNFIDYIDIEGTGLSSEISHTRTDLTA